MICKCLFSILIVLLATGAQAQVYKRQVNFEWEEIPGAKSYEVEIQNNEKTYVFKSNTTEWTGKLPIGPYTLRLRAKDARGVPGEWSEKQDFPVQLDSVTTLSPADKSEIHSSMNDSQEIVFKWKPVAMAKYYKFEVLDSEQKVIQSQNVEDTQTKISLPVAQAYTYKVTAFSEKDIPSESTTTAGFLLVGKKLDKPTLQKPPSEYVRKIDWNKPEMADTYDMEILKYDGKNKTWQSVKTETGYKENSYDFPSDWKGGHYKVRVTAKANNRPNSQTQEMTFRVINGDRSPAAELTATIRRSIDRVSGFYGIASYLVTKMNYSGRNPENNASVNYDAFGGTGRVGVGYLSKQSPWGFLGIVDYSGYIVGSQNFRFATSELHAIHRAAVSDRGELRTSAGIFYKELPETLGNSLTHEYNMNQVRSLGVHGGVEYWHSLTPRFGVQANARLYYGVLGLSTPNGQSLVPSPSYQLGFLGSYIMTPHLTGLIGYAYRKDTTSYQAKAGDPSDPTNTSAAKAGDVNTTEITGHYLNLFLEWGY